jgi:hypothetical protein
MTTQQRSNLVVGLLLLLVGGWFLAGQFYPGLTELIQIETTWPLFVIGVGLVFLVLSVIASTPSLAVPAAIISGVGAILYWQDQSGDFGSWAYAWTLIPGFVGVGIFLASIMEGRFMHGLRELGRLAFLSAIMFGVFGGFLGGPDYLQTYWPVLLIAVGVWLLGRGLMSSRRGQPVMDHAESPAAEPVIEPDVMEPEPVKPVEPEEAAWEPAMLEDDQDEEE